MSVVWSCVAAYWAGRILGALIEDVVADWRAFSTYGTPEWSSAPTEGELYYWQLHKRMGGW